MKRRNVRHEKGINHLKRIENNQMKHTIQLLVLRLQKKKDLVADPLKIVRRRKGKVHLVRRRTLLGKLWNNHQ